MTDQTLVFKERKVVRGVLEMVFYKDYTYILSDEPYPVVCYKLSGCMDIEKIDFGRISRQVHEDLRIDVINRDDRTIFTMTDELGESVSIECGSVERLERAYELADLKDMIMDLRGYLDRRDDREQERLKQRKDFDAYLAKEMEATKAKLTQADWLTAEKRQYLTGYLEALKKVQRVGKRDGAR